MAGTFLLLANAAMAQQETKQPFGRLKVCKVAGPGVPVGTPFTITADNQPQFTVIAGPAPGGYCAIGPLFPVGSYVPVTESLSNGTQLINSNVQPPGNFVWPINNGVIVQIGNGVTEVTFTNKRTGYIEVCKQTDPAGGTGNYTFFLNPGGGPYTIPAGSCTPAIEVPAGTVTIHEVLNPGVQMVGCSTLQGAQISCNPAAGISTVNVAPGNIANQTIAMITNRRQDHPIENPVENSAELQQEREQQ